MALIRKAYQKLGIDLNRANSVIPEHILATNAGFSYLGTTTDLREERDIGGFTPGTTTVDSMALEMVRTILRTIYGFYEGVSNGDARSPIKWNTFYLANEGATVSAGVVIPLGDLLLELDISSKLKLQNISYNGSTTADPDVDTTDNVNQITLEGYHYKGWGNHMLMKGDTAVSYRAATNEPPLTTDRETGVLRKNPSSTASTGPAMDTLPVKPFQWQHVNRGAPVMLDPGVAKTDFINQKKTITWQSLLEKLLVNGTNNNTNTPTGADNGPLAENWSNQGKFSAFGLSRLINYDGTGTNKLQCTYEVEQKVYCKVARIFQTPAVATTTLTTGVNIVQS